MKFVLGFSDLDQVLLFEIGENILFIHEGKKEWEGNNAEIMNATNKALNEFLFTSKFNQLIKEKWEDRGESKPKDKV